MSKETDFFNKFMGIMEVLYAVLLSWGFANIAQSYRSELAYILPSIIAGLVLIRFFFAPAHNLYHIAIESREHGYLNQLMIFLFDIPMLIFHSFVYFRMCIHIANQDYLGAYYLFFLLLFVNIIWLLLIEIRIAARTRKINLKHYNWMYNNALHLIVFVVLVMVSRTLSVELINLPFYWVLFGVSLSNCLIDFALSAQYYLGFKGG